MPSSIVTMIPPGSRPGMTSLAMAPTIRPKMIQPRTPIMFTSGTRALQNAGPQLIVEDVEVFERAAGVEQDDRFVGLDRPVGHERLNRDQGGAAFRRGADPLELADRQHPRDHRRV